MYIPPSYTVHNMYKLIQNFTCSVYVHILYVHGMNKKKICTHTVQYFYCSYKNMYIIWTVYKHIYSVHIL